MKKNIVLAFMAVILLNGCATIVGERTQLIPIASTPSEAVVLITDEKGFDIFNGLTPTAVILQKSDDTYFGKKKYTVKISKEGFITQTMPLTAGANGWYYGGNLLFAGLGWFIVDPLNGSMYTLSPEQITMTLAASPDAVTHGIETPETSQAIPLEPIQPIEPIEPIEPVQSIEPVQPIEPVDAIKQ